MNIKKLAGKYVGMAETLLKKSAEEKSLSLLLLFAISFLCVVVTLALAIGIITILVNLLSKDAVNPFNYVGPFGDFIGGVLNPILTFLMFLGVLVTIVIQSKELEATRKELSRSANAQESSERTQSLQTENLRKQRFESTFFSLLEQHNDLLKELNAPPKNHTQNKSKISQILTDLFKNASVTCLKDGKGKIEEKNAEIGHYFRVLYQILKFISLESPLSNIRRDNDFYQKDLVKVKVSEEEKFYSNIVRSFLSYDIAQILAVNCYCNSDGDSYYTYKLLVERYSLFEHMPLERAYLPTVLEHYAPTAFGQSDFVASLRESA